MNITDNSLKVKTIRQPCFRLKLTVINKNNIITTTGNNIVNLENMEQSVVIIQTLRGSQLQQISQTELDLLFCALHSLFEINNIEYTPVI